MKNTSQSISFFIQLAKTQARLSYKFDRTLGGLSFTEFLILFYLDQAQNGQLSRIELAEKVGLTASGVTRVLLPMAKIHLVKDGPKSDDARVRTVAATAAGREKMRDELERLQFLADELVEQTKNLEALTAALRDIEGKVAVR